MSFDDEVFEGYLDGLSDDRDQFPDNSNRSAAYCHGWLNGRDDRLNSPRDTAANIRAEYDRLHREHPAHSEYYRHLLTNPDECPQKIWEDTCGGGE